MYQSILQEFKAYYREHIGNVVDEKRVLRCHLSKHGFETSIMPTTNLAESGNAMLQRLINWKSKPIDAICLSLLHFCDFQDNEITASRHISYFLFLNKYFYFWSEKISLRKPR